MLTFFILLFIAICIVLGILIYRYDLMKAYYKYQTNELSKLEEKFDKREKMAKDRIDELQNTAYINATTNIWNIDYFITKSNQAITFLFFL